MKSIGIDIGSRTTKIAVLDSDTLQLLYTNIVETGINPSNTANTLYLSALNQLSISNNDIFVCGSTGYGRNRTQYASHTFSEILCHTRGVLFENIDVRTIIDIGGQDSKLIYLDNNTKVYDFVMNDKCAAGTGRFLEKVATILELDTDLLDEVASQSNEPAVLTSTCVVFAESEIIGLLVEGVPKENVLKAVNQSIAKRIRNMAGCNPIQPVIAFTGGVANQQSVLHELEAVFNCSLFRPKIPSLTGAIGAAIIAQEQQNLYV